MSSKLSSKLISILQKLDANENIDIIIEMPHFSSPKSKYSRQEKIANIKAAFDTNARVVEQAIQENGGEVIDRAWINQTMKVRLPVASLDRLLPLKEVSAIDIPKVLKPEQSIRNSGVLG